MSESVNLFGDDQSPAIDPNKDYYEELVGEGKKFKTPADLAKGKVEADAFIEQVKGENAQLRKELDGRIKLEEFVDKFKLPAQAQPPMSEGTPPAQTTEDTAPSPKALTMEDVERLFALREKSRLEDQNLRAVAAALEQTYGSEFQKVVRQKTKELGVGEEFLTGMAKQQPNAFLRLLGVGVEANVSAPPPKDLNAFLPVSSVNSSGFNNNSKDLPKKFSDFEKLRKERPSEYYKPEVQNEMFRLTREYKDKFLNS